MAEIKRNPTWERNKTIRDLRNTGMSAQQIADRYGLTRQRICQISGPVIRQADYFHERAVARVVFPGLRAWMITNRVGHAEMARRAGLADNVLRRKLIGQVILNMDEIDAVLKVTGLTYEAAFGWGGS